MCNDYEQRVAYADYQAAIRAAELSTPASESEADLPQADHIRIGDMGPVLRAAGNGAELVLMRFGWPPPRPKAAPVFNFRSEGRDFSRNDRVLILADGFFEYTQPKAPGVKLKDRHLFTMSFQEWFWIAGIVKEGCFTMLTTEPGPDLAGYHDRQIATFTPEAGMEWLGAPSPSLLRPPPAGTFKVRTLRKDGVDLAA